MVVCAPACWDEVGWWFVVGFVSEVGWRCSKMDFGGVFMCISRLVWKNYRVFFFVVRFALVQFSRLTVCLTGFRWKSECWFGGYRTTDRICDVVVRAGFNVDLSREKNDHFYLGKGIPCAAGVAISFLRLLHGYGFC